MRWTATGDDGTERVAVIRICYLAEHSNPRFAGPSPRRIIFFINVSNLHLGLADDFADIETFVTVVEAGGFSAAARIVNLSRSAVGKAVSRLELRLGSHLFHRTTRSQT
jgi:hypothetical protein